MCEDGGDVRCVVGARRVSKSECVCVQERGGTNRVASDPGGDPPLRGTTGGPRRQGSIVGIAGRPFHGRYFRGLHGVTVACIPGLNSAKSVGNGPSSWPIDSKVGRRGLWVMGRVCVVAALIIYASPCLKLRVSCNAF